MSRRDDAIVAWHEVPGRAPSPKEPSRRVRYDSCRTESIENAFGAYMNGIAKQVGSVRWPAVREGPKIRPLGAGFRHHSLQHCKYQIYNKEDTDMFEWSPSFSISTLVQVVT